MSSNLENAYIIGSENLASWSQGYDRKGYLKVLPHPDVKISFKDPFQDWQNNQQGNYISSWGPEKELEVTLKAEDLEQIVIDGFGVLKSGDGKIPWLNNQENPYEFLRGFNGTVPGPMLITEPGDTLKIKLENNLENPEQPINLHTHGLHVSPLGRGDNVLVSINSGQVRDISIKIPENESIGTNWYHPHLHGLSTQQISSGLGGQLWVGPPHNLPDIEKWEPKKEQIHFLALNTFGIQQTLRQGATGDPLNQDSSLSVPAGTPLKVLGETENGENIYEMSDAVNFGHNFKPIGYDPQNPIGDTEGTLPFYGGGFSSAEPLENVIHTVNGQYNPTLELVTGEWNSFVFSNISADTFHVLQLVKQEGDKLIPQKVGVVGMDSHSSALVTNQEVEVTELPLINPASRISIQKWFEEPGTYYLLSNGTEELLGDYTSPLIKGHKGFNDGFSLWGPQVLATIEVTGDAVPPGVAPEPYDFLTEQATKVDELVAISQNGTFNRERTYTWAGNFGSAIAAGNPTTLEGAWRINGEYFALDFDKNMIPLTMPMLGTTELWTIKNASGKSDSSLPVDVPFTEWHPFHIHQNDFTVLNINGIPVKDIENQAFNGILRDTIPLAPTHTPNSPNPNNPYGTTQPDGDVSTTQLLMRFDDYPGTFVNHCHILAHQDAGMMIPVRTILNTEDTWLGLGSKDNRDGIELIRASNLQQHISLMPYGQEFQGAIKVAIGDVNYNHNNRTQNVTDNVTDVITIQQSPEIGNNKFTIKVFDGQSLIHEQEKGERQFDATNQTLLLAEFHPFQDINVSPNTKASIATGDLNGDGYSDIIVGIGGEEQKPLIEIYSGKDSSLVSRIAPFHHETNFNGTINLAAGDVNGDNYDDIIVSQGEGGRGLVELYSGQLIDTQGSLDGKQTSHETALLSQPFQPYGDSYHGDVKVTSGYILQRPDVANGEAVQTYHANITTMAVDSVPDGQQQIKVFTYLLDEHHNAGHNAGSGGSLADEITHYHGTGHDTDLNGSFDPRELRLDTAFTPENKLQDLYGTFADIPCLPRGEAVLYGLDAFDTPQLIQLQDKNVPTSIDISSSHNNAFTDNDHFSLGMYNNLSNYDSLPGYRLEQPIFPEHSHHVLGG
jgi:hypothetical protein